jgi:pSer/pThr/pTyr-binding forkhead associated (FHA) protein
MKASGRNWMLVLIERDKRERCWPLKDGITKVGRDPANPIYLRHESVSRHHAQVNCGETGVSIEDLKSRNGVTVNGVPRQKAVLQPGDRLKIGRFELDLVAGVPSEHSSQDLAKEEDPQEITLAQDTRLPVEDRELHTLYHICSWFTEGGEVDEVAPKCLRLLLEAFRSQEAQLYAADGRLEAFASLRADKPVFKLAAFLAERFQASPEAVSIQGETIARHQQRVGRFNYLVGPLRPTQSRLERPPFLMLLRPADSLDFTRADRVLLQLICQMWVRGQARANQVQDLRRENAHLKQKTGAPQLLGVSSEMERLRFRARKAAPTKVTMLVLGETGSGKEVVAHFIHQNGPRKDGPFIKVNCAAIPDGLIESELFGHVKGAFTDARDDRKGKFAQADHGTLFLDEIGEMPLSVQAKVLRAIENGEIEPVGSERVLPIDVRIIAATHRNLDEMVRRREFRQDLFYRLNVMAVPVPPLREHLEDIDLLAGHFLERFCDENGLAEMSFAPEALTELKSRPWPGNVRELRNVVQRCAASAERPIIAAEDVLLQI